MAQTGYKIMFTDSPTFSYIQLRLYIFLVREALDTRLIQFTARAQILLGFIASKTRCIVAQEDLSLSAHEVCVILD
jgi:hypothetical protein